MEAAPPLPRGTPAVRLMIHPDVIFRLCNTCQMTDLLQTLPNLPAKQYTHLLPSLEKHFLTTTDLLTLDPIELAKRAQLPLLDLRRLRDHVVALIHTQLGLETDHASKCAGTGASASDFGTLKTYGEDSLKRPWNTISTLDETLDAALGGGIPPGYITEIAGESGAGKTQLLLTLLLSVQLPAPHGLARPAIYISTEHSLPTPRLSQLLRTHPILSKHASTATLSQILTLNTPDLESQDHILTYQLPVAVARQNIGLVIIDSIAANYRAERSSSHTPSALATRSAQLIKLGASLRSIARDHNCAIVVANQVADRFASTPATSKGPLASTQRSTNVFSSSPASTASNPAPAPSVLSLDHQQRFFTGWGAAFSSADSDETQSQKLNLKTPSLGLVWANQIACRVVLIKEAAYGGGGEDHREKGIEGVAWTSTKWRRWLHVVFAPWTHGADGGKGGTGVEFEIWGGGVRAVKAGPGDV